MSEWCEHLVEKFSKSSQKDRWFFSTGNFYGQCIADDWKQCPICGKPRPTSVEPEPFRDKLIKQFHAEVKVGLDWAERIADTAIDTFHEEIIKMNYANSAFGERLQILRILVGKNC